LPASGLASKWLGSRARGENRPDSDADLALILHERGNDGTLMMLAGLAWYVFLDRGIMIQPVTS
jgi:predicted nucleotidyltransferase